MIISKQSKPYRIDNGEMVCVSDVHREKDEKLSTYQRRLIQAMVDDKMPPLPYSMDNYEALWEDEPEYTEDTHKMGIAISKWCEAASKAGFLHGKQHKEKREMLWQELNPFANVKT